MRFHEHQQQHHHRTTTKSPFLSSSLTSCLGIINFLFVFSAIYLFTYRLQQDENNNSSIFQLNTQFSSSNTSISSTDSAYIGYSKGIASSTEVPEAATPPSPPTNNNNDNNNEYRLEFLHIPKNGGSSLEHAAVESGIVWGICHFPSSWHKKDCGSLTQFYNNNNSNINNVMTISEKDLPPGGNTCYWHLPLQRMKEYGMSIDNYDTGTDNDDDEKATMSLSSSSSSSNKKKEKLKKKQQKQQQKKKKKRFFVILRNPYDRFISYLYFVHGKKLKEGGIVAMNELVSSLLTEWSTKNNCQLNKVCPHSMCFIPQYDYVYDETDTDSNASTNKNTNNNNGNNNPYPRKVVDHIIHFENYTSELHELMKQYNLNVTLNFNRNSGIHHRPTNSKLNITHLNSQSIRLINQFYSKDFVIGGYDKIDPSIV